MPSLQTMQTSGRANPVQSHASVPPSADDVPPSMPLTMPASVPPSSPGAPPSDSVKAPFPDRGPTPLPPHPISVPRKTVATSVFNLILGPPLRGIACEACTSIPSRRCESPYHQGPRTGAQPQVAGQAGGGAVAFRSPQRSSRCSGDRRRLFAERTSPGKMKRPPAPRRRPFAQPL